MEAFPQFPEVTFHRFKKKKKCQADFLMLRRLLLVCVCAYTLGTTVELAADLAGSRTTLTFPILNCVGSGHGASTAGRDVHIVVSLLVCIM